LTGANSRRRNLFAAASWNDSMIAT